MPYSTSNPPRMFVDGGIGGAPSLWLYTSADAAATVDASNYFTNGYALGMRDGDLAFVYNSAGKIWTAHTVTVNGQTVDLSDGTIIGVTTNTD